MLEKVEKYWHEQNFKNRNEAIRDLVEKGLKKDDEWKISSSFLYNSYCAIVSLYEIKRGLNQPSISWIIIFTFLPWNSAVKSYKSWLVDSL